MPKEDKIQGPSAMMIYRKEEKSLMVHAEGGRHIDRKNPDWLIHKTLCGITIGVQWYQSLSGIVSCRRCLKIIRTDSRRVK